MADDIDKTTEREQATVDKTIAAIRSKSNFNPYCNLTGKCLFCGAPTEGDPDKGFLRWCDSLCRDGIA